MRAFADGRVFTGSQAKELGLVDELGDEEHARKLAAKLADLDEADTQPITLGKPKKKLIGLLPGSTFLSKFIDLISFEFSNNGQILWLFKP